MTGRIGIASVCCVYAQDWQTPTASFYDCEKMHCSLGEEGRKEERRGGEEKKQRHGFLH